MSSGMLVALSLYLNHKMLHRCRQKENIYRCGSTKNYLPSHPEDVQRVKCVGSFFFFWRHVFDLLAVTIQRLRSRYKNNVPPPQSAADLTFVAMTQ